jgi:hypothetical protein
LLRFKIWLDQRSTFICLDSKFECMEKLLILKIILIQKLIWWKTWTKKSIGFKNWLDGKIAFIEKLLGFKNYLDEKTVCIKKTTWIQNLIR